VKAAAQTGVSTSEVLQILAICITIVGALIAPTWAVIRRTRRRLRAAERKLDHHLTEAPKYRHVIASITARGFAGAFNSFELVAGLQQRLMSDRLAEIDIDQVAAEQQRLREDVERAWMELRLLTGNRTAQNSALQQLKRIGDASTERLLGEKLQEAEFTELSPEQMDSTAKAIRERRTA